MIWTTFYSVNPWLRRNYFISTLPIDFVCTKLPLILRHFLSFWLSKNLVSFWRLGHSFSTIKKKRLLFQDTEPWRGAFFKRKLANLEMYLKVGNVPVPQKMVWRKLFPRNGLALAKKCRINFKFYLKLSLHIFWYLLTKWSYWHCDQAFWPTSRVLRQVYLVVWTQKPLS